MSRLCSYRSLSSLLVAAVFSVLSAQTSHAQQLGIKTNALMWALATPNLGCEFVVKEHSTVDISAFGHYKPYGLDSELVAIQPEYRYWFNGRPMIREFVGISAMVASYDITTVKQVYDGLAASLGVTCGYAFLLGRDWRLELSGGVNLLFFNQKKYYRYDDYYVDKSTRPNSWGYKLFPAEIGVTFTYIIK